MLTFKVSLGRRSAIVSLGPATGAIRSGRMGVVRTAPAVSPACVVRYIPGITIVTVAR